MSAQQSTAASAAEDMQPLKGSVDHITEQIKAMMEEVEVQQQLIDAEVREHHTRKREIANALMRIRNTNVARRARWVLEWPYNARNEQPIDPPYTVLHFCTCPREELCRLGTL